MLKNLLSHTVSELTVAEAKAVQGKAIFLDAREWKEYEVSHIANAKYVGYDSFDLKTVQHLPKDQPIVVYCSVGYRSEKVAEQLKSAGYQQVTNLYGGIFEWRNQGNGVVNQTGSTEKVHAYNRAWGVWLKKGEKVY
ncbi:MAG: rhodanese-like domain-containing protein [Saprospiraceae bacterium]|nr:rhodanese-like domain-containing protein [Saprospiraceae bacterium]